MRLLLVEDDARVAEFITAGLRSEGYVVETAGDGPGAIEAASRRAHELILLDVALPGTDGYEVCRRLRERGLPVPILMLTGKDSPDDQVKGFESGADDYMTKPFPFEVLLARIRALLRRGGKIDVAPELRADDLVLDRNTHTVCRAGKPIALTPKEFALLEYLLRRAGRVLSRAMIEEQVWGNQHATSTNVVDVYIRRLRQKVDRGHGRCLIRTVRGIGYQIAS